MLNENDPIQKTLDFQGLELAIEWPAGSTREYKSDNFKKLMVVDYGYVVGTKDFDGEEVDVYVGKDLASTKVYKLRQLAWDGSYKVDETKWMLGFSSKEEAIKAYVESTSPNMFGGIIDEITIDDFKAKMLGNQNKQEETTMDEMKLINETKRLIKEDHDEDDIADIIADALADNDEIADTVDFRRAGLMTRDTGLVVTTESGDEFQVTIVRSR